MSVILIVSQKKKILYNGFEDCRSLNQFNDCNILGRKMLFTEICQKLNDNMLCCLWRKTLPCVRQVWEGEYVGWLVGKLWRRPTHFEIESVFKSVCFIYFVLNTILTAYYISFLFIDSCTLVYI